MGKIFSRLFKSNKVEEDLSPESKQRFSKMKNEREYEKDNWNKREKKYKEEDILNLEESKKLL